MNLLRRTVGLAVLMAAAAAVGTGSAAAAPASPWDPVPVAAPPALAGPKISGEVLFVADYETGDFSQWQTCQSVIQNGACADYDGSHYSLDLVPGRLGHHAARFVVRDGDVPEFGGGERSEVSSSQPAALTREGDERWYRWSMRFAEDFVNPTEWLLVTQWHGGDGSPPLAVEVSTDGQVMLSEDGELRPGQTLGPVRRGEWADYVLHVKFSRDPAVGFVEGWENGVKSVPKTTRATMNSSVNYLKQGIYRDAEETGTHEVWIDELTVIESPPAAVPGHRRIPQASGPGSPGGESSAAPETSGGSAIQAGADCERAEGPASDRPDPPAGLGDRLTDVVDGVLDPVADTVTDAVGSLR